jgi:hypothetical protein
MNQTTVERKPSERYYRLTNEEWLRVVKDLKPAERDILYYIRTLDPFGTQELELGVREMADTLGCNPGTVSRALKVLDQKGYIELDLVTVRVRIKNCNEVLSVDNTVAHKQHSRSVDNTRDRETTPVISRQHPRSPKPSNSEGFKKAECTNNNSLNLLNQQNTSPTPHPVKNPMNEVGLGTVDAEVLRGLTAAVEDAEIPLNQTIRREITWTIQQHGTEEAIKRVRNAISAIEEQKEQNKVRNPGGLLMRALRSGFTANEEKRRSRQNQAVSEVAPQPQKPDIERISHAIDTAMLQGDRPFILGRLQQLWAEGWQDITEELCKLRRDWGVVIGEVGPQWKQE